MQGFVSGLMLLVAAFILLPLLAFFCAVVIVLFKGWAIPILLIAFIYAIGSFQVQMEKQR